MEGIAIVAVKGFGHEGQFITGLSGDSLGDVVEHHRTIGPPHGVHRLQVDFMLRRGDFVMGFFKFNPAGF